MNLFKSKVKKLIEDKDFEGLRNLLASHPELANEGITIPYDPLCQTKAHPLHRLCDAVYAKKMTDEEAIQIAQIFLDYGADIDGDKDQGEGTPILAAASLHAEQLGIFYVDKGADIYYTYQNNGESALHWAAYCGRDQLVDRLIQADAPIDIPDKTYNSTPLGWALHSLLSNDEENRYHQEECIESLLRSGADIAKLHPDQREFLLQLANDRPELKRWTS